MIALIDGDVLKYMCGFASDAQAKLAGLPHEDVSYCLHGVNKTVNSILEATGVKDYVVFVSHPINHRKALYPDYKANRDPTHKPHWFKEIDEFLFNRHNAVYSEEGDEADDAMGILQSTDTSNYVIATIDKDLDCIPGWHYNFSKNRKENGLYWVDEEEANRCFYKQILTGDTSDNIPGMWKLMGKKATKKYTEPLEKLTTPDLMYQHVVDCYDGNEETVKWLGDLLYIKRDETGVWLPK